MVGVEPVQGASDQEVTDFVAAVVVDQRAPVLVLAPAGIFVFVQGGTVEPGEGVFVLGKMAGYPVQQHPDAMAMALVHQIAQVVGAAVPAGGGVVTGGLVTPGLIQRVFSDRQQLNVGKPQLQYVGDQLVGQLPVGEPAARTMVAPGAGVNLIDGEGRLLPGILPSAGEPVTVAPVERLPRGDHGGIGGAQLELLAVGVGLHPHLAPTGGDGEFVQRAGLQPRNKCRPHAGGTVALHWVRCRLPAVEVSNHADRGSVRRPYGEADAMLALELAGVRSQDVVDVPVTTLAKQIQVVVTEQGAIHRRLNS